MIEDLGNGWTEGPCKDCGEVVLVCAGEMAYGLVGQDGQQLTDFLCSPCYLRRLRDGITPEV